AAPPRRLQARPILRETHPLPQFDAQACLPGSKGRPKGGGWLPFLVAFQPCLRNVHKKTDGMEEIQFLNFRLDRKRCARLICGTSSNICCVFWVSEMRVFKVRGGWRTMSKLLGTYSLGMKTPSKPRTENQELASPTGCGLGKLGRLTMAMLLGAILVLSSGPVMAQAVSATLLGSVADSSGGVVAGAKVVTTEMKTGVSRATTTNDSGNYEFPDLPPGQYEVAVEREGFKKSVRSGVHVLVNSDVRVNVTLEPGTIQQTVTVTAELPVLQTDRSDTGRKMEERQAEELPLTLNRNFQGLLNLVPGTTRAHRDHSTFFNAQDSLSTEVNGQSRLANNLLIEGVDDNERTGLLQVYIPPIEAIETVDVTTSSYDAELGRAGGSVTNVILKS